MSGKWTDRVDCAGARCRDPGEVAGEKSPARLSTSSCPQKRIFNEWENVNK
jgi:hypothetical protein